MCYKSPQSKQVKFSGAQRMLDGPYCLLKRPPLFLPLLLTRFVVKDMCICHSHTEALQEKGPPPFSLAYPTLHPVLEVQLVSHINPYYATVVIINHVKPQIINFNKGLLCLMVYFLFVFVHVIFPVTVFNICTGLVSYILQAKILGRLYSSSIIESLMVPYISSCSFFYFGFFLTTCLVMPR